MTIYKITKNDKSPGEYISGNQILNKKSLCFDKPSFFPSNFSIGELVVFSTVFILKEYVNLP